MFNYSEEVIYYLKESERIALSLNSKYVEVTHLFLSLLSHQNKISDTLLNYDCDYSEVKKLLKKDKEKKTIIFYKESIKRILSNSLESLKEYNRSLVTEEILFLSMLEESDIELNNILNKFNINVSSLYKEIKNNISNDSSDSLLKYGINLNEKSLSLDKIYGRDTEINKVIEVLARKKKNNPLLIGNSGVGKTAIIEELARRIKLGLVPSFLLNYEIISLPISSIVSGSKYRGEFEEKLENIIKECENNKKYILFIDEVHTIVGAGGAEGAIDASNILKPYLARNNIKLIGATTTEEYNKYIKDEKALERRFNIIFINEPNKEETLNILNNIKKDYEEYHKVKIKNEVINFIVNNSSSILPNRYEPDRSIDLLDRICAFVKVNKTENEELKQIKLSKIKYLKNKEYDKAISTSKKEKLIKNKSIYKTITLEEAKNVLISNNFPKSINKIGFFKQKDTKKAKINN